MKKKFVFTKLTTNDIYVEGKNYKESKFFEFYLLNSNEAFAVYLSYRKNSKISLSKSNFCNILIYTVSY